MASPLSWATRTWVPMPTTAGLAPGSPAGYPAADPRTPLDPWIPDAIPNQRYGGLYRQNGDPARLTSSKSASDAHNSSANYVWEWLGWRKAKVGEAAMSAKERAFFDADRGRSIPGSATLNRIGSNLEHVAAPVVDYVVRPAVATAAAGVTGGASVLAGESAGGKIKETIGVRPAVIGYAEGAAAGALIAIAPGAAMATGIKLGTGVATAAAGAVVSGVTGGAERPPVTSGAGPSVPPGGVTPSVPGPSWLQRLARFAFPG